MLNYLDVKVAKTTEKFDSALLFLCKECKAFLKADFLPEQGQDVLNAYLAKESDFFKTGKIGKVTYLVSSAPSEKASDTIDKKIAKMIRKEVMQNAEKASV